MAKRAPAAVRDCRDHQTLHTATAATPSANGRVVYVICGCGQRRAVWPELWEAELQRRAGAGTGQGTERK